MAEQPPTARIPDTPAKSAPGISTAWLGNVANNAAIVRLLELGALETDFVKVTPELLKHSDLPADQLLEYKPTAFGRAMLECAATEMIGMSPEVQSMLESMFQKGDA